DVASTLGANQFIGGTYTGSQGGKATVDIVNRTLIYTPKTGTIGVETFNYTISDFRGGVATTTVKVNIVQTAEPPRPVDDSFAIATGAPSTDFDVYANDSMGTGTFVSLKAPAASLSGGSVLVVQPGNLLRYTPPVGFTGLDRVIYTIRDSNGLESSATMTLHVGNDSADDVIAIDLVVTDATGIALSEVVVGQSFQVRAYVRDLRVGQPIAGVAAAYLDLLYSQSLVAVNTITSGFGFDVMFGAEFSTSRSGSSAVLGVIDEIGGARGLAPATAGPTELFRVNFTAMALGMAAFTADPADLPVAHDVMFVDPTVALPVSRITFDAATVEVVETPTLRFLNQSNARDVDGDGHVSPVDAVMIINQLNANGISSVAGRAPSLVKPMFWDVSGDNKITPYDAVLIINYLNARGAGEAPANTQVMESTGASEPARENAPATIVGLLPHEDVAAESLTGEVASAELAADSPRFQTPYFWLPSEMNSSPASEDSDAEQTLDELLDLLASDIDVIWQA
ncbi:MAG TPA: Ig-like domain-containing protein, partial [Pirellulaceae bacterium]|nr:Ig-like domain-containing protein [Pirellulaceae bacterium]